MDFCLRMCGGTSVFGGRYVTNGEGTDFLERRYYMRIDLYGNERVHDWKRSREG